MSDAADEVDYSAEGHEGGAADDEGSAEQLEELQQMLSEMEESQTKIAEASNQASAQATSALAAKAKLEEQKQQRDERSVFVQNVDFKTTGEELMAFFQPCGSVERVTILADKFGHPKGYVACACQWPPSQPLLVHPHALLRISCSFAYVEFNDKAAVENALVLSGTAFKDRPLKIITKRTNVPSFQLRGRGRGGPARGRGYFPRGGGFAPRGRGGGYYHGGGRGGGFFRGRGRGRGGY
jgi:polyadenylate-binding protein 2